MRNHPGTTLLEQPWLLITIRYNIHVLKKSTSSPYVCISQVYHALSPTIHSTYFQILPQTSFGRPLLHRLSHLSLHAGTTSQRVIKRLHHLTTLTLTLIYAHFYCTCTQWIWNEIKKNFVIITELIENNAVMDWWHLSSTFCRGYGFLIYSKYAVATNFFLGCFFFTNVAVCLMKRFSTLLTNA